MRHQHEHAKPQPGLEEGRRAQQEANRIVVAERRRQFDEQKKQLDILRKTRAQRDVGSVEIPKHLQRPVDGDAVPPHLRAHQIIDPRTGKPFK